MNVRSLAFVLVLGFGASIAQSGEYGGLDVLGDEIFEQLVLQPAYVGSMQTALRRLGYYCGPINGVFSAEVSDAIARFQKNYSMRVTGTLTDPVRRALHMP